jgi:hypothetical protein
MPPGYEGRYEGFPYKQVDGGKIEILTNEGPKTYKNWKAFTDAIGAT